MTVTEALGVAAAIVLFLALQALGQEWDHQRVMDDRCAVYGKTYSHQHRACVRPQR